MKASNPIALDLCITTDCLLLEGLIMGASVLHTSQPLPAGDQSLGLHMGARAFTQLTYCGASARAQQVPSTPSHRSRYFSVNFLWLKPGCLYDAFCLLYFVSVKECHVHVQTDLHGGPYEGATPAEVHTAFRAGLEMNGIRRGGYQHQHCLDRAKA